jgi:arabinofuranosyltransferase
LFPSPPLWPSARAFSLYAYSLYDDAYIYLRYAENLATGCGLRFRCDGSPPVEGFTSPLFMACLALFRALSPDLETVTQIIGPAFLGGAIVCAAAVGLQPKFGQGTTRWRAALLSAAITLPLSVDPFILLHGVTGLETTLGCLTVTAVLLAGLDAELRLLRTALVLAALSRPEGVLLLPVALALPATRRVRYWLPVAAVLGAVTLARFAYYGDVLPNTYYAKSGGSPAHLALGLEYLRVSLGEQPLVLLAPLALIRRDTRLLVAAFLAAAAVWTAFVVRVGGDTFYYARLLMPLIPALYALAAVGVSELVAKVRGRVCVLGPGAALAASVVVTLLAVQHHVVPPTHGFANVERWKVVGQYLRRAHPGALVATVPIGAISYFSNNPVLDLVGLTSREIAHAKRTVPANLLARNWIGHERHNLEWVLAQKPDIIVSGTKFQNHPFTDLQATRAGFYAEWLLLREIKARRAPYVLYSPEIVPGVYWLMFRRVPTQQ